VERAGVTFGRDGSKRSWRGRSRSSTHLDGKPRRPAVFDRLTGSSRSSRQKRFSSSWRRRCKRHCQSSCTSRGIRRNASQARGRSQTAHPRRQPRDVRGLRRTAGGAPVEAARSASPTDLQGFAQRGSLTSILAQLRDNPRVHIVHNADDVLTTRNQSDSLSRRWARWWCFRTAGISEPWYSDNKDTCCGFSGRVCPLSQDKRGRTRATDGTLTCLSATPLRPTTVDPATLDKELRDDDRGESC